MVPVWIGRRQVMAVVDTAAQVTMMSRALSEELGCGVPVEKVQLRNAQQDSWMDGGIHEHFGFQLGVRKYYWDVVEADIGDSFIIGIDFLMSVKCKIDLALVPLTIFLSNSKFDQICRDLIWNMCNRSQRNFAHVTTVTLSWRMQNFVVIGDVYFEREHSKFWSNFEFDRNIVSGTGAWTATTWNWPMETGYQPPSRGTPTVRQYMWIKCCCIRRLQYH